MCRCFKADRAQVLSPPIQHRNGPALNWFPAASRIFAGCFYLERLAFPRMELGIRRGDHLAKCSVSRWGEGSYSLGEMRMPERRTVQTARKDTRAGTSPPAQAG